MKYLSIPIFKRVNAFILETICKDNNYIFGGNYVTGEFLDRRAAKRKTNHAI